jgi:hypothetical protein
VHGRAEFGELFEIRAHQLRLALETRLHGIEALEHDEQQLTGVQWASVRLRVRRRQLARHDR